MIVLSCGEVVSAVPQGLVLAPILFLIYENEMPGRLGQCRNSFAIDTQTRRRLGSINYYKELKSDLEKLMKWSLVVENGV